MASTRNGTLLLTSTLEGKTESVFCMRSLGTGLVTYTHHDETVLYTSTKQGSRMQVVMLHSLHDNRIIRCFGGESALFSSMCMSPVSDTFATASMDGTFTVWDIRSPNPAAQGKVDGIPAVSIDPTGTVLSVATRDMGVALYDITKLDKGHFLHKQDCLPLTDRSRTSHVTQSAFSPDGKLLALTAPDTGVQLLDSFDLVPKATLLAHAQSATPTCGATFTPDSRFLLAGSSSGRVAAYDLSESDPSVLWLGSGKGTAAPEYTASASFHPTPIAAVRSHPSWSLIATAAQDEVVYWTYPEA